MWSYPRAESHRDTLAKYQIHLAAFLCIPGAERLERCVGKHPKKLWVKIPNYFCLSTYIFWFPYCCFCVCLALGAVVMRKAMMWRSALVENRVRLFSKLVVTVAIYPTDTGSLALSPP